MPGEIKHSARTVLRAVREAFPAQAAVNAALLAKAGVAGFEQPLEGREGFYALFAGGIFSPDVLLAWQQQVGGWDKLINRSSTTWRQLPEARKSPGSDAEWKLLLKEYPQLIRRPVVVGGAAGFSQGFSDNGFKKQFGAES